MSSVSHEFFLKCNFYHIESGWHGWLHLKTSPQPLNPFDRDPFKNCAGLKAEASVPQRKWMRHMHCSSLNAFQCAVNSTCRADGGVPRVQHMHFARELWSAWTSAAVQSTSVSLCNSEYDETSY